VVGKEILEQYTISSSDDENPSLSFGILGDNFKDGMA